MLAFDRVRHHGEPVAVVAAEDLATARRAAALIAVDYEPLPVLGSVEAALGPDAPALHPDGNTVRAIRIVHGDPDAPLPADAVTVRATYEVGMQDQAFLGPEAGLARPLGDGGVELEVATQWLHLDREQIAAALGLPEEQVRLVLAGVGGAFGGREDISVHVHACLLALATGRPVKMSYAREESFVGHVHRHPARLEYEHAAAPDGRLLRVRAQLRFDGGAYASSSTAVIANAATLACGPYAVPDALIEGTVAYTNNPPCGAMRGFGAPQVAIAYEAQMDRLAARLGLDPLELRVRNALTTGAVMPTGQRLPGPADAAALLDGLRALPLPDAAGTGPAQLARRPVRGDRGRGRAARRRLRVRLQEHRVLRGLRRLLGRARARCRWRTARRSPRSTAPPPRSARASSGCASRSRARSSASSGCACCPPTPRSARPARRPRAA